VRLLAPLACATLVAGCSHGPLLQDHPLAGLVWSTRTGAFVAPQGALERAAQAHYVILGEVHDNPEHHRLQRVALGALARYGEPRALALEQFDAEHQRGIEAARARGADVEALADAGRFDRAGWNWPLYRPLIEFALEHGWPLVAANLSRAEAGAIVRDPSRSGLPPPDTELRQALERDMVESHCGKQPEAKRLAGMVEAQRARDVRLARVLAMAGASVLITGNGHARRDRGVPLYLPGADIVSIGIIEVEAHKRTPQEYAAGSFDYVWFTSRARRVDPCPG
jgi:uncharacterized iron-regulated protein